MKTRSVDNTLDYLYGTDSTVHYITCILCVPHGLIYDVALTVPYGLCAYVRRHVRIMAHVV